MEEVIEQDKGWELFNEEERQEIIRELTKVIVDDMAARIFAKMTPLWELEKLAGEDNVVGN